MGFLAIASSQAKASDHHQQHSLLRGEHHRSLENYGNNQIVGNDRYEHGCIGSAGYSWCASLQECLRPFETTCPPVHDNNNHNCPTAGESYCAHTRQCEYPTACYDARPVVQPVVQPVQPGQWGCRVHLGESYCHASQTCEMYGYCLHPIIPGGDRDQHGCIGSAGYSWCDSLKECIRTFDTTCPPVNPGGDVDQYGCRGSAGYSYCPSSKTCERYYDCRDHQKDDDMDQHGCIGSAGY